MSKFMDDYFDQGYNDEGPMPVDVMISIMQDMKNRQEGNALPDTIGAEYYFLQDFITLDMDCDFTYIEKDFLKHCSDKLPEFLKYTRNIDLDARYNENVSVALQKKILYFIYGGAQSGDAYCRELLKYLFKIYHRNLYLTLKRFRTISMDEILGLADEKEENSQLGVVGIVLIMCPLMGIAFSDEVSVLYFYLIKKMEDWKREEYIEREFPEDGLFEECMKIVDAWMDDEKLSSKTKYGKKYFADERFAEECMNYFNYPGDFPFASLDNFMGLRIEMTRTLMTLKMNHPKKEYTYEQIQHLTMIYTLCSTIADIADRFDMETDYLLSKYDFDYDDDEDCLFDPKKIEVYEEKERTEPAVEKTIPSSTPVSEKTGEDENEYLKEIARLRSSLDEKDREIKRLRDAYGEAKASKKEAEEMVHRYESEREELIALREFAYQTQQEEEIRSDLSVEEMKTAIKGKKIAIIGGHVNWHNKLKQQFPDWRFVLSEASKTVDGKMLEGCEKVYFYTDHMSHVIYGKFIAAVRERKIPFGYLGSIHIESVIKQVYEDLCGE